MKASMTAEALVKPIDETSARTTSLAATIGAARSGDHAAFEALMIATERHVAQLAWNLLGDPEEVKDALQETFLRVYRHLRTFDASRDFDAWLGRITVNVCRDLQRARTRRRIFAPLDEAGDVAAAIDTHTTRDAAAALERALASLPEGERRALVLRDLEERPTEEVAAMLGNSAATVRVQIHKARAKLRRWLKGER